MTSGARYTALLDANVLYPALMRGILLELNYREVFNAKWTRQIENEWTRTLRRRRPDLDPARVERTRHLMRQHFHDALVLGYEKIIDTLDLPDPDDRHVLAAAIVGGCDVIVTQNLRDFPPAALDEHSLSALHPDDFLILLLTFHRADFLAAVRDTRAALRNPAYSVEEFLENLARQNLTDTASALRNFTELLESANL